MPCPLLFLSLSRSSHPPPYPPHPPTHLNLTATTQKKSNLSPPPPPPPPTPPPQMSPSPPSSPSSTAPTPTSGAGLVSIASPAPTTRRIPPPCWTNDETLALLDSYRDKWLSLRRANLRAAHWDEVCAAVSLRCRSLPGATPKTSLQCRHKIEKLRKRYRSERNRALSLNPSAPPSSPWIFFPHLHSMENPNPNPNPNPPLAVAVRYESDDDADNEEAYLPCRPVMANGGGGGGLKFKIPKAVRSRSIGGSRPSPVPNPRSSGEDPMGEVVRALTALGEGYVRAERAKMEMAREMEQARMEAELRRTETVLDAQRRIVDLVVGEIALGKKKRKKAKAATAAASGQDS